MCHWQSLGAYFASLPRLIWDVVRRTSCRVSHCADGPSGRPEVPSVTRAFTFVFFRNFGGFRSLRWRNPNGWFIPKSAVNDSPPPPPPRLDDVRSLLERPPPFRCMKRGSSSSLHPERLGAPESGWLYGRHLERFTDSWADWRPGESLSTSAFFTDFTSPWEASVKTFGFTRHPRFQAVNVLAPALRVPAQTSHQVRPERASGRRGPDDHPQLSWRMKNRACCRSPFTNRDSRRIFAGEPQGDVHPRSHADRDGCLVPCTRGNRPLERRLFFFTGTGIPRQG